MPYQIAAFALIAKIYRIKHSRSIQRCKITPAMFPSIAESKFFLHIIGVSERHEDYGEVENNKWLPLAQPVLGNVAISART